VYSNGVVNHSARNAKVAMIARTLGHDHLVPTIVLARRRKHADLLGQMIAGSVVVKGGEASLTDKRIEAFRKGDIPVLVGTTVIGEGVDVPAAAALVYASGGNGTVEMMQSYFRPLTSNSQKQVGLIYDFADNHHRILRRQSNHRVWFTRQHLNRYVVEL
jgi:superfamily II DNA or RNA helicase